MKQIHVIIATGMWEQDGLKYRRHRLAEFLQRQPETQEVIWICPTPDRQFSGFTMLKNGIREFAVQDLLPNRIFRFGRFVDLFYQPKLKSLLSRLFQLNGHFRFYLWYTCPEFPLLPDLFPWDKVVYDCSDLWSAPISGELSPVYLIRQGLILRAEQRIIGRADLIFCTSDYLHEQMLKKVQVDKCSRIFTAENGVAYDLFSRDLPAVKTLPENFCGTVLGYIGGIKPKLDFELIKQAAVKKRDWLFLFVGPDGTGHDPAFRRLLYERNVLWLGRVAPADVPEYMKLVDVGIMPYKPSPYNQAVFPLKLFEFLAAGKPAVGVHLPSTQKYSEEGVYASLNTDDPDSFVQACEQMEALKNHEDLVAKRRDSARAKDWNEIFRKMLEQVLDGLDSEAMGSAGSVRWAGSRSF